MTDSPQSEFSGAVNHSPSPQSPQGAGETGEIAKLIESAFYSEPTGTAENAWNSALEHVLEGVRALPHPTTEPRKDILPFVFTYKNYRGEIATRVVTPISVRFGSTEWHPEPQWLMKAFDHEKQAEREFAMMDITEPTTEPVQRGETVQKSDPAATNCDTLSGSRPPASAAMGHCAGSDTQCEAENGEPNEYFDMLWKWFEERGAFDRYDYSEGRSAEDFKIMLDEHEAALLAPEQNR